MVGAEGIEPSTSSASRKHSTTELRAYHTGLYILMITPIPVNKNVEEFSQKLGGSSWEKKIGAGSCSSGRGGRIFKGSPCNPM